MDYKLGKTAALAGCGGWTLLGILELISSWLFNLHGQAIGTILAVLYMLCTLAAAAGFAIMFLNRKNKLDLSIASNLVIYALIAFLSNSYIWRLLFSIGIPAGLLQFFFSGTAFKLVGFFAAAFAGSWAAKFLNKQPIVAMLLGASAAWTLIYHLFLYDRIYMLNVQSYGGYSVLMIVLSLVSIGCHAIYTFAAYAEE